MSPKLLAPSSQAGARHQALLPRQTLQHWLSGRMWSFSEQFKGGHASVIFTKTPPWKSNNRERNCSLCLTACSDNQLPQLTVLPRIPQSWQSLKLNWWASWRKLMYLPCPFLCQKSLNFNQHFWVKSLSQKVTEGGVLRNYNNRLLGKWGSSGGALICSICWFLWCEYPEGGRFWLPTWYHWTYRGKECTMSSHELPWAISVIYHITVDPKIRKTSSLPLISSQFERK